MKKLFILSVLFLSGVANAQKEAIVSGSFKNLESVNDYNIVFDYSGMKVGAFDSEAAYLDQKSKTGDAGAVAFKKNWITNRLTIYEIRFIESFSSRFRGKVRAMKGLADAKITLTVKTVWLQPGTPTEKAKMSAIITATATADPSKVLLAVQYENLEGDSLATDGNEVKAIADCYQELAKQFSKNIKQSKQKGRSD